MSEGRHFTVAPSQMYKRTHSSTYTLKTLHINQSTHQHTNFTLLQTTNRGDLKPDVCWITPFKNLWEICCWNVSSHTDLQTSTEQWHTHPRERMYAQIYTVRLSDWQLNETQDMISTPDYKWDKVYIALCVGACVYVCVDIHWCACFPMRVGRVGEN